MSKVLLPDDLGNPIELPQAKPRKPLWPWILLLGTVLIGVWWSQSQRASSPSVSPQASVESQLVSQLSARYQAEVQWSQRLSSHAPYSIEIERALVRQDRSPIVFIGTVMDVLRHDQDATVEMDADPVAGMPFIRFSLTCSPGLAARLVEDLRRPSRYIAVARVDSVSKARFRIDAYGQRVGEDEVETELEIQTADHFLARGQCVELQPIP